MRGSRRGEKYRRSSVSSHVVSVPDVTGGIPDDLEGGLRVDTDQAPHGDDEPRFFVHFTTHGLGQGLTDLDGSAGQAPLTAVRALLEQESAATVDDHGGDAGADSQRVGDVRLERDHEPAVKSRPNWSQGI